jgi:hypothetical protein
MIKYSFSYTDEFGQECTLSKSFDSEGIYIGYNGPLYMLIDEFKTFLVAAGFSKEEIDRFILNESRGGE